MNEINKKIFNHNIPFFKSIKYFEKFRFLLERTNDTYPNIKKLIELNNYSLNSSLSINKKTSYNWQYIQKSLFLYNGLIINGIEFKNYLEQKYIIYFINKVIKELKYLSHKLNKPYDDLRYQYIKICEKIILNQKILKIKHNKTNSKNKRNISNKVLEYKEHILTQNNQHSNKKVTFYKDNKIKLGKKKFLFNHSPINVNKITNLLDNNNNNDNEDSNINTFNILYKNESPTYNLTTNNSNKKINKFNKKSKPVKLQDILNMLKSRTSVEVVNDFIGPIDNETLKKNENLINMNYLLRIQKYHLINDDKLKKYSSSKKIDTSKKKNNKNCILLNNVRPFSSNQIRNFSLAQYSAFSSKILNNLSSKHLKVMNQRDNSLLPVSNTTNNINPNSINSKNRLLKQPYNSGKYNPSPNTKSNKVFDYKNLHDIKNNSTNKIHPPRSGFSRSKKFLGRNLFELKDKFLNEKDLTEFNRQPSSENSTKSNHAEKSKSLSSLLFKLKYEKYQNINKEDNIFHLDKMYFFDKKDMFYK